MLPENLGLSDEGLNAGITRYNEMVCVGASCCRVPAKVTHCNRAKYPVARIKKEYTRDDYQRGEWSVNQAEKREKENESVNEMLTSVPTQEKQYRDIAGNRN